MAPTAGFPIELAGPGATAATPTRHGRRRLRHRAPMSACPAMSPGSAMIGRPTDGSDSTTASPSPIDVTAPAREIDVTAPPPTLVPLSEIAPALAQVSVSRRRFLGFGLTLVGGLAGAAALTRLLPIFAEPAGPPPTTATREFSSSIISELIGFTT